MARAQAAAGSASATGRIERSAPAKLNLYLKIVGRRADGYHLLDSLVAFATVGDRIRVAPAARFSFRTAGRFAHAVPSGAGPWSTRRS